MPRAAKQVDATQVELGAEVVGDRAVGLSWLATAPVHRYTLLTLRTGAVAGHTSWQLGAQPEQYQINNLGRHQRYRFAVPASARDGVTDSTWWSATPGVGLTPTTTRRISALAPTGCTCWSPMPTWTRAS